MLVTTTVVSNQFLSPRRSFPELLNCSLPLRDPSLSPSSAPGLNPGDGPSTVQNLSVQQLAATPAMAACLEWFRRERAWINEQHLKLCRMPAPTFFEDKRAAWMAEQFRALGWQAGLDRAGNVIATLPDRTAQNLPAVAVTAHLDTVLAPRTPEDIRPMGDGRLEGPGVADNGAGLTALLSVAAAWTAHSPLSEFDLDLSAAPILIANVGEEGEGNLSGFRYICRSADPSIWRAFLVLDGPGVEHITTRALASRRFEIQVSGAGGHSWRDAQNANAVHALSRIVTLFSDRMSLSDSGTDSAPRSSFNFGIFDGGASINSIPNEAWAKLDLRSESAETLDDMARSLNEAAEEAATLENRRKTGTPVTTRIKEIGSRPGGQLPEHAPLLKTLHSVDQFLGIRSRADCSSTDANIPLSLGIPAVSIGVGGQGGGAHSPGEWYSADGREVGLRRVMLALCKLLL